jgi:hypothetical protein
MDLPFSGALVPNLLFALLYLYELKLDCRGHQYSFTLCTTPEFLFRYVVRSKLTNEGIGRQREYADGSYKLLREIEYQGRRQCGAPIPPRQVMLRIPSTWPATPGCFPYIRINSPRLYDGAEILRKLRSLIS